VKLDQRFCRDSRSIDKIDKSNEERVHLGRLAMEEMKKRVLTCETIQPIDHTMLLKVILLVNTSVIAIGFILAQLDIEG